MQIQRLSFINHKSGWNVRDIEFNRTTLLVGASGVGKTQILNAIETVSDISRGYSLNGIEWSVSFTHEGKSYTVSRAIRHSSDIREIKPLLLISIQR